MQSTVHVIANWANVRLRVQDFELAQIVSENQTKNTKLHSILDQLGQMDSPFKFKATKPFGHVNSTTWKGCYHKKR